MWVTGLALQQSLLVASALLDTASEAAQYASSVLKAIQEEFLVHWVGLKTVKLSVGESFLLQCPVI